MLSASPIMVETETVNAVLLRKLNLLSHHVRLVRIVIIEIVGQTRLTLPKEAGQCMDDTGPPARIIAVDGSYLPKRAKLRQIKGDGFNFEFVRIHAVGIPRHVPHSAIGEREIL